MHLLEGGRAAGLRHLDFSEGHGRRGLRGPQDPAPQEAGWGGHVNCQPGRKRRLRTAVLEAACPKHVVRITSQSFTR